MIEYVNIWSDTIHIIRNHKSIMICKHAIFRLIFYLIGSLLMINVILYMYHSDNHVINNASLNMLKIIPTFYIKSII